MGEFDRKKIESGTEGESKPRRVFVEVGTNTFPVSAIGEKKFKGDDIYVGIDNSFLKVERARLEAEAKSKSPSEKENLLFVVADAKELPLENESVSEVFFGNVYGDPTVAEQNNFLEEAIRILKDGGHLTIKEDATPFPIDSFKKILSRYGFSIKKLVTIQENKWREEVAPYDHDPASKFKNKGGAPSPDSYILETVYKNELAVFIKEINRTKKEDALRGWPAHLTEVEPCELTEEDAAIYESVKSRSITKVEFENYSKKIIDIDEEFKTREGISLSRRKFFEYIRNLAGVIFGRQQMEEQKRKQKAKE